MNALKATVGALAVVLTVCLGALIGGGIVTAVTR